VSKSTENGQRAPQLVPGWAVFMRGQESLLISRDRRRIKVTPSELGSTVREVANFVGSLDGTRRLEELIEHAGSQLGWTAATASDFLAKLASLGILFDAKATVPDVLTLDDVVRYDRQLAFFGASERPDASRFDFQARLKSARVVILGLGGGGSWCLAALMGTGIGEIVGIDGDKVELSNLDRQILFRESDVGRFKAEVIAERMKESRPQLRFIPEVRFITSQEDIEPLLDNTDLLIVAGDQPPHRLRQEVTRACLRRGVPHLVILGPWVGPLCIPGKTACYGCYEVLAQQQDPYYASIVEQADRNAPYPRRSKPGHGAAVAAFVAWDVVAHLTQFSRPATYNGVISIALEAASVQRLEVPRQDSCEYCGVTTTRQSLLPGDSVAT
jgi:bacteriocin biosynthesis cyclodehydratase domain-containing protein